VAAAAIGVSALPAATGVVTAATVVAITTLAEGEPQEHGSDARVEQAFGRLVLGAEQLDQGGGVAPE
jgi:hypothetical protein